MDASEPPRLVTRVRHRIRFKHYSLRTEEAYVDWIKRFIVFHNKRHPSEVGAVEVEAFLTNLAVERNVSPSTQNQAKSAILFLYREVLGIELPWLAGIESAKRPARLPVILTSGEVQGVLRNLDGVHYLIGRLLYGSGMRILEAMRLRVKDVDFSRREIIVRDGKGAKDRITMLPNGLARPLKLHLLEVAKIQISQCRLGLVLAVRFPADRRSVDPRTGAVRRHHLGDRYFQRAIRQALRNACISKPRRLTRCGIRSQPTCSNGARTYARFK